MRTYILLALALFFTMNASAQTSLTCSQNGTLVTFTNGVLTPKAGTKNKQDAENYLKKIVGLLPATDIDKQGVVKYKLKYNISEGFMLDLYQSLLGKIAEFYGGISTDQAAFRYIAIIESIVSVDQSLTLQLSAIASDFFSRVVFSKEPEYESMIADIKNTWSAALKDHKKIIAISHSQGGLIINDAYNALMLERPAKDRSLFAMLQVATPASQINAVNEKGTKMGEYLTNNHDFIRIFSALTANAFFGVLDQFPAFYADQLGHSFDEIYIKYFPRNYRKN